MHIGFRESWFAFGWAGTDSAVLAAYAVTAPRWEHHRASSRAGIGPA
jgi:hypothetical protein